MKRATGRHHQNAFSARLKPCPYKTSRCNEAGVQLCGAAGIRLLRKTNQSIQFFAGGAGVDGIGGEAHAVEEIRDAAGGDERGGGVGENDVAMRRVFAIEKRAAENSVDDFGVVFGVAASVGVRRRAAEAEIFGRNFVRASRASVEFGDVRFAAERNFVEAVGTVNDEGAFDSELRESAGEKFGVMRRGNADDLRGGSGGIGERAEKIENGANAESAAHRHCVFHRGVNRGREKKADADLFDGRADVFGWLVDDDAELFEHVGGSGARTCSAIAVFGDAHARARDDECRGGGNVEGVAAVSAGAASVDEHFVGVRVAVRENFHGVAAHGGGEADQFVDGFAFHAKSDEESGDKRVIGVAGEDLLHAGFGFVAGETFFGEKFFKGGDHGFSDHPYLFRL